MSDPTPLAASLSRQCTVFLGTRVLAAGPLIDVSLAVKAALAEDPTAQILTFDDADGRVIDLDLRGSTAELVARLAGPDNPREAEGESQAPPRGRGRPKLGVVAREVTLLPRHWEWLARQRGGASHALRRLVDEARKADAGRTEARVAQENAYRFLSAMAGNLPGFEEAMRALFASDRERFAECAATWPAEIRQYAERLAWGAA